MIQRCQDYRRIKKMVNWRPLLVTSEIIYLVEVVNGVDMGVWTFHEYNDGYMVHADMKEGFRGSEAVSSLKKAFDWIFENTKVPSIYAKIPEENKPSSRVAVEAGMDFSYFSDNHRFYEVKRHG